MSSPVICPMCGDVVGVYEPVLVVTTGFARMSSIAREPDLGYGGQVIMHQACGRDLDALDAGDGGSPGF